MCLCAMQRTTIRHQHAVRCWRCSHQCFDQPASVLIQLQWPPQSNRLCSAAGRLCSDWHCLCAVYLLIFIRLPDSGEIPTQQLAAVLPSCHDWSLPVGQLLVAADLHTLTCTLCYSLNFRHCHPLHAHKGKGACIQWMLLACFKMPSTVCT